MECRNVARPRNPAYGMQKCGETVQRGGQHGAQAHEIETDERCPLNPQNSVSEKWGLKDQRQ